MSVKLLTEHHLEFLSLTGGFTGLSESTLVKMSNCWKSHAAAQLFYFTSFLTFCFIMLVRHFRFYKLVFMFCRFFGFK